MIKKIIANLIFLYSQLSAQFLPGARQIGMGNAVTSVADDHWTIYYNSAGMTNIKNLSTGVFYSPAPFGLKELAIGSAAVVKRFNFGNVGFAFQTYGFELYRENKISIAFAKKFFNQISFGLKTNVYSLSIQNYGNDMTFGLDIGLLTPLSENLQLGVSVTNINRPTYGVSKERLSQTFSAGLAYKAFQNLIFAFELEKEVRYPFNFKFGLDYSLIDFLSLQFGYNTEPSKYFSGLGIHYSKFRFNYSFFSHNVLGFTHNFGIDYNL